MRARAAGAAARLRVGPRAARLHAGSLAATRLRIGPLAALVGLAVACSGGPPYELPEERSGGAPLTHAQHPRTGEITWRASELEQTPEGLRVGFTLVNGTSRDYLAVMLRIVLRGPAHETATARYPAGPLAARSSKRIQAHLTPPGFEVEETQLELLWAQE